MKEIAQHMANVPKYANVALLQLVYLIIGMVVAASVFLHARLPFGEDPAVSPESLSFYRSFSQVMGAQIFISLINTTLTAMFLIIMGFPYAPVLIVASFLCGLVPIIGNIISNTLITTVGLTDAPDRARASIPLSGFRHAEGRRVLCAGGERITRQQHRCAGVARQAAWAGLATGVPHSGQRAAEGP